MALKTLELNSTISSVSVYTLENSGKLLVDTSTSCPFPGANITYVDFYLHDHFVSTIFIVSYLLIFVMCMFGNGVVCFIVLRRKHMRTVTNLFILNLAISDLLVGIFCMPTTLVDNIITDIVLVAGSRGQQSKQGCSDFPPPRHFLQLFRRDSEVFPGQPRDIVSPACPGLPRGLFPVGHARNTSPGRRPRGI
ncbi:hypothetical protein QTP70_013741 [Hemibagrus guttatus]|uniref:G-protein coupled receptors family 1 profile domain-containing protein n=1 Tax=Hemibagrus guttatus TaxID=175788 RepID=A0AAE0UJY4_9TELE|nr:hypothetical protein QTP70_013741 [Hemibagrus guttatus]